MMIGFGLVSSTAFSVQVALILPWLKPVLAKRQRIKVLYRCWNIISFSRTRNIPVHAVVSPIPINARHYWQQGD